MIQRRQMVAEHRQRGYRALGPAGRSWFGEEEPTCNWRRGQLSHNFFKSSAQGQDSSLHLFPPQ
jgi:hypothetical protein